MIGIITEAIAIVATMTVVTIHAVVTVKDTIPTIESPFLTNPFVSIPGNAAIGERERRDDDGYRSSQRTNSPYRRNHDERTPEKKIRLQPILKEPL